MRRRDPHEVDEAYDGVLSALALSGGIAAIEQLAVWLGGRTAAAALVAEVVGRGMGQRVTLPGEQAEALALRRTAVRLLLGRSAPGTLLEWTQYTAIHRFEYHLRENRPLHPAAWITPELFAGGPVSDPDEAAVLWRALARLESVFVDLHPQGARLVIVDRFFAMRQYQRLMAALTHLGDLMGRAVDLRVLCGSPLHRQRARRLLAEAEETLPATGVAWGVLQLDTVRYFADRPPPPDAVTPPPGEGPPAESVSG
ncbi:MAG: hypothetical protein R3F65_32830 [bacterium]